MKRVISTKSYGLLCVGLFFVLLLAACGNEQETNQNSLEGVNPARATAGPTSNASAASPLLGQDAAGVLVFTAGHDLYLWDIGVQAAPQLIAEAINIPQEPYASGVFFDPDLQSIIYGVDDDTTLAVHRYHITDDSDQIIYTVEANRFNSNRFWQVYNWSPDGKWAVFGSSGYGRGTTIIPTDGTGEPVPVSNQTIRDFFWLADNRLLLPERDYEAVRGTPGAFAPIVGLAVIDPEAGTRTALTELLTALDDVQSPDEFRARLAAEGYPVYEQPAPAWSAGQSTSAYQINIPEGRNTFANRSQFCWTYTITRQTDGEAQVIYQGDDINWLGNLRQIGDEGAVVFSQISYPDCTLGTPHGELIRWQSDGNIQVITDQLASQLDQNAFSSGFPAFERYAVSPDGQYMAYIDFEPDGADSQLLLYEVASGDTIPVVVNGAPLAAEQVYWLPE